jgi:SAM-dependent methyltransferase
VVTEAEANTLKAYDAIAPLYSDYSSRYRDYLDAVDQLVVERLQSGVRLLDVGSGDGRRLKKIAVARQLTDVVSVEPSSEMATLCRAATGFPVHQLFGDELHRLPHANFDAITALWNVFGHMADSQVRLKTLENMKSKLAPGGSLLLDVNNRHNQLSYGRWNVMWRRMIDTLAFDETRGDVHYEWKIGNESVPASGHLFAPAEIEGLFRQAGLKVVERLSINYGSGEVSISPFNGQLFFCLEHA